MGFEIFINIQIIISGTIIGSSSTVAMATTQNCRRGNDPWLHLKGALISVLIMRVNIFPLIQAIKKLAYLTGWFSMRLGLTFTSSNLGHTTFF